MKKRSTQQGKGIRGFNISLRRIEITALIALGLLFAYPLLTSARTSPSANSLPEAQAIHSEIAALLEQVEKLKAQLKELQRDGIGTSTPDQEKPKRMCPPIARVLLSGARGDDVVHLQEFLAEEGYFDPENVSSYFGPLTKAALQRWQAEHGIVVNGDATTTGWGVVGPRTKEFILKRCGGLKEDRMQPFPPRLGTSTSSQGIATWPGMQNKGSGHSAIQNMCPPPTMPPATICDGALRLEWRSHSGSLKCLEWKCHGNDAEDSNEKEDDDANNEDDDAITTTDSN